MQVKAKLVPNKGVFSFLEQLEEPRKKAPKFLKSLGAESTQKPAIANIKKPEHGDKKETR